MNFRAFMETFDRPANIFWEDQTDGGWMGKFQIEDNEYMINLEEHEDVPNVYEITFSLLKNVPAGHALNQNNYTITKTGNSMLVFSTVMQAIKEFDSVKKPIGYMFSVAIQEPKRKKLYLAIIDKFGPKWYKEAIGNSIFVLRKQASKSQLRWVNPD